MLPEEPTDPADVGEIRGRTEADGQKKQNDSAPADAAAQNSGQFDSTMLAAEAAQLPSAEYSLADAPSFPAEPGAGDVTDPIDRPGNSDLQPGNIIDDFQIRRVLGQGGFGTVYLALQLSLGRFVALKVSKDLGLEGRTMARLQHPNIVQVYSEGVLPGTDLRALCVQYVAGPTLDYVLEELNSGSAGLQFSEADFRRIVRDFAGRNSPEAVQSAPETEPHSSGRVAAEHPHLLQFCCRLMSRICRGAAWAHAQGVVHRDIKPANILLDADSNPLLTDFNLSDTQTAADGSMSGSGLFGGTPAYMAPEHLTALLQTPAAQHHCRLDSAVDVYSLALVGYEVFSGRRDLPDQLPSGHSHEERQQALQQILQHRRQPPGKRLTFFVDFGAEDACTAAATAVRSVIQRAAAEEQSDRTASAVLLADEFEGCRALSEAEQAPVMNTQLLGYFRQRPFSGLLILAFTPHLIASASNIAYNSFEISRLAAYAGEHPELPSQVFARTAIAYNLVVWPLCFWLAARCFRAALPAIRHAPVKNQHEEKQRRVSLLKLPTALVQVAAIGWLPGILAFPISLSVFARLPLSETFPGFAGNLLLSFLIALSYSYTGVCAFVVSTAYLHQWTFPAAFCSESPRTELAPITGGLRRARTSAAFVPLSAALLVLLINPSELGPNEYFRFRLLLVALVGFALVGLQLVDRVVRRVLERISLFCR